MCACGRAKPRCEGTVREVAASADPVTRTFTVKVALEAKDALPLGSTVSVSPKALDRGACAGDQAAEPRALLKAGRGKQRVGTGQRDHDSQTPAR